MKRPNRGRRGGLRVAACTLTLLAGVLESAPAPAQVEPTCTPMAHTRLRLRKVDDGVGNERILFRGELEIDELIAIDLAATGVRFEMLDAALAPVVDVVLPAVQFGADRFGWTTNGGGTVWSWRDHDSDVSGFRRATFKRPSRSSRLRFALFGQDFEFALPTLPLTLRVTFATADGVTPICGHQIAQEVECHFRNEGNKLICR